MRRTTALFIITLFAFLALRTPFHVKAQSDEIPLMWQYNSGAANYVWQVDISNDGRYIVAGTGNALYLFERSSSNPVWSVSMSVTQAGISGDGRYIVACVRTDVYLYDRSSSSALWNYAGNSVAISNDGNYISVSHFLGDTWVGLLSRDTGQPVWTSPQASGDIDFTAISSNGEYVVAGSDSGKVWLFQNPSSTPVWTFQASNKIKNVCISEDGNYIAAGCEDHHVYFFSKNSGTPIWDYATNGFFYSNRLGISMSDDGEYMAVGSGYGGYGPTAGDRNVYLFRRTSNTPILKYPTTSEVQSVSISEDGQHLIAGNAGGQIYFFNKDSNTPIWSYDTYNSAAKVAISSDGKYAVAGTDQGKILLFGPLTVPPPEPPLVPDPWWTQWWLWLYTTIALGFATTALGLSTIYYHRKAHATKGVKDAPARSVSNEYKVCPSCGASLPPNSKFCGKCGTSLE